MDQTRYRTSFTVCQATKTGPLYCRSTNTAWRRGRLLTSPMTSGVWAAGLLQAGLARGQRVAVYSPNRPEWLIGCLAVLYAAAVPVPIDSQIAGDDLTHVVKDSDARWIMTIRSLAGRLSTLGLNENGTLILLDAGKDDPQSWQRLRRRAASPASAQPDDEALLFYTSGVSGRPKGVPLSHRNLLANLQGLVKAGVYRPNERLLLPLPLHHVYPFMIGLLAPVALGIPIILPHSLTGPQIIRALREGSVTAIVGVPRLYAALVRAIERRVSQKGRIVSALFMPCSPVLRCWRVTAISGSAHTCSPRCVHRWRRSCVLWSMEAPHSRPTSHGDWPAWAGKSPADMA